jgi:hypothetical protein
VSELVSVRVSDRPQLDRIRIRTSRVRRVPIYKSDSVPLLKKSPKVEISE